MEVIFPISIKNAEQLQEINNDLSGAYILADDIDMTDFAFMPIGSNSSPFTGIFDENIVLNAMDDEMLIIKLSLQRSRIMFSIRSVI